jgi:tetratricopeptide (TPR) repeat protein
VQPAKVHGCAGPHAFHPNPGEHAVNAARFPIPPGFPFTVPATDQAAVNHYFYKSRQCFAHKIAKGNPCNIERRMQDFERHLSIPTERDDSLIAYAPRVAALLDNPAKGLHTADAPRAPKQVDRQQDERAAPWNATTHLFAARQFLQDGKMRQALLHLCHAVLHNEQGGAPDPVFSLDVWTLRAEAAVKSGNAELAEHCLRQAFICGPGHKAFALFAEYLLGQEKRKEARAIMDILSTYKNFADAGDGTKKAELLLPEGRARLDADKSWWRLAEEKA